MKATEILVAVVALGACRTTPSAPPRDAALVVSRPTEPPREAAAGRRGFRRGEDGVLFPADFPAPGGKAGAMLELSPICELSERVSLDQFGQVTRYYQAELAVSAEEAEARYRDAAAASGFEVGVMEEGGLSGTGHGFDGNLFGRTSILMVAEPNASTVDAQASVLLASLERHPAVVLPAGAVRASWSLSHDGREMVAIVYRSGVQPPSPASMATKDDVWRLSIDEGPLVIRLEREPFGPAAPACSKR